MGCFCLDRKQKTTTILFVYSLFFSSILDTDWQHESVLISEVECIFVDHPNKWVVIDATLGLGWHASMLASHMATTDILIGIDRDRDNLELARSKIQDPRCQLELIHASFADLSDILDQKNRANIDFILYDLGVSSAHYDDGDRGFSIRYDAPLDMRFDRTTGRTARDLVMTASEYELRDLMWKYADEKKSVHIARGIVEARKLKSINTTFELLDIIRGSSFDRDSPKRVFQALRIAVNSEFEHIERSLAQAIAHLSIWWKIAVITFHSIEDRIIKNIFAPYLNGTIDDITGQTIIPARLAKYTKKPIEPTEAEVQKNPRSRSAKLRVVTRIH
jgi:16S rRNA (cytosine1402-N4)-methyltransferase